MKIFCVITLYYPDWELVRYNLKIMSPYLDKIVLWNNTPNVAPMKYFEEFEILSQGENIGLSRAYTEIWKIASAGSYDYLMTMDQDSQWEDFPTYIKMMKEYEKDAIQKHKTLYFVSTEPNQPPYTQISIDGINSGAIIPIELLNKTMGYNTDFFVDCVDYWLIANARKKGYDCVQIGETRLIQKFGNPKRVYFFGKTFYTSNYSAIRIYGILRNHLILFQKYDIPKNFKREVYKNYLFRMPIKIILGEKHKWTKIKAFCCGVFDGLLKRPSRIRNFMQTSNNSVLP